MGSTSLRSRWLVHCGINRPAASRKDWREAICVSEAECLPCQLILLWQNSLAYLCRAVRVRTFLKPVAHAKNTHFAFLICVNLCYLRTIYLSGAKKFVRKYICPACSKSQTVHHIIRLADEQLSTPVLSLVAHICPGQIGCKHRAGPGYRR